MARKYVVSQHYLHPTLGEISIRARSTACRLSARWKRSDLLIVTIPAKLSVSDFERLLNKAEPILLSKRPMPQNYCVGWSFETPEVVFCVRRGDDRSRAHTQALIENGKTHLCIYAPLNVPDSGHSNFDAMVVKFMKDFASKYASKFILPLAEKMAEELKVKPASIGISHGRNSLGKCNSRGEITLSKNLMFYPEELRRYVIAHEFAHLTHLNHGERFYALFDKYLGCDSKAMKKDLNKFRLPFD